MSESSEFNIFSASAQQGKKKKILNPPSEKTEKDPNSIPVPETGENVNEMLERMHHMHREIQSMTEATYEKAKFSPKQLENFLKVMTGGDVQKKNRKALEEKVWSVLGEKFKAESVKQEQDKSSKERKGKTIGARKSWLPMR